MRAKNMSERISRTRRIGWKDWGGSASICIVSGGVRPLRCARCRRKYQRSTNFTYRLGLPLWPSCGGGWGLFAGARGPGRAPPPAGPGTEINKRGEGRAGDGSDCAFRGGDRASRVHDAAHDRCGLDSVAYRGFVSAGAAAFGTRRDGDGAGCHADADFDSAAERRPRAGGRTADGGIRGAAAYPEERATASASGNYNHAQARVVHAGGVVGAVGVSE